MTALIRVILIDPRAETRSDLEALLRGLDTVRLVEVCTSHAAGVESVHRGGVELVVIDLDADIEGAFALIETLLQSHPDVGLLPVSRSREVDLVLRAVRSGAREFLTLPVEPAQFRDAVGRVAKTGTPPAVTGRVDDAKIVAILGGAGGVGCTTLAVNLGATLAHDPTREVVLVDLDLVLGSVDACLDLAPDQTLTDVARSVDRLDDTLLKRSLTRHDSGLFVLTAPATLDDAAKIDPDSLRRVLERLHECFPIVLLDLGKTLSAHDFLGLELAETILLVVQLEPACLRNCVRLMDLLRQFDGMAEKVRVAANRVGSNGFEVSPKKAEDLLHVPVKWMIPNEYKIVSAARTRGVPIQVEASGSRIHRAILELARDFGAVETERNRTRFGRIAASLF